MASTGWLAPVQRKWAVFFVIAQSGKPDPAGMRAFLADFEKQLNSQRQ